MDFTFGKYAESHYILDSADTVHVLRCGVYSIGTFGIYTASMAGLLEKKTQAQRVLEVLQEAKGDWVNGQKFLREMYLSQYHARIFELQHRRDRYKYTGEIEVSSFKDNHGFVSYRLKSEPVQAKLL